MQQLLELKNAYCNSQLQKVKELEVLMVKMIENGQFAAQILDILNTSIGENQMGQLMFIVSLITLLMKRISKYNDVNLTHFYRNLTQTQVNNVILKKSAQLMAVYLEKNIRELPALIKAPFNGLTLMILSELLVLEDVAPFLSEWCYAQSNINHIFQSYIQDPLNPLLLEIIENALELYKDNIDFIQFIIESLINGINTSQDASIADNHIHVLSMIATISIRPNILSPIFLNPQLHQCLLNYCHFESTGEFYIRFLELYKKANVNINPPLDIINAFHQVAIKFSSSTFPICLYALYLFDYTCKYKVDIHPCIYCCVEFKPLIKQQQDEDKVYIQQAMAKVQSILSTLGREHPVNAIDLIVSHFPIDKSCHVLPGIIRSITLDPLIEKKMHQLLLLLLDQFNESDAFTKVVVLLCKKLPNCAITCLEKCLSNIKCKNSASIIQTVCMHHSRLLMPYYGNIAPTVILNDSIPIAIKFSIACIPLLSNAADSDLFTLLRSIAIPECKPKINQLLPTTEFTQVYTNELIEFLNLAEQFLRLKHVLLDPLKSSIVDLPVNIKQLYHSFLEYICQCLRHLHHIIHTSAIIGPSSIDMNQILRTSTVMDHPINIQINLLVTQLYDVLGLALGWPLFYENENAISILTTYIFTEDVNGMHLKYWSLLVNNVVMTAITNSKASQHKSLLLFVIKPFLVYMGPIIKDNYFKSEGNEMEQVVQHHYLTKLIKGFLNVVESSMTMMTCIFGQERAECLLASFELIDLPNALVVTRYYAVIKEHLIVVFMDFNMALLTKCISIQDVPILAIILKYFIEKDSLLIQKCIEQSQIQHKNQLLQLLLQYKTIKEPSEKAIRKQLNKNK